MNLVNLRDEWKTHLHHQPTRGLIEYVDRAAMDAHRSIGNSQANPKAILLPMPCLVRSVERLKDRPQFVIRNSRPVIADPHNRQLLTFPLNGGCIDVDQAAVRNISNRIAHN